MATYTCTVHKQGLSTPGVFKFHEEGRLGRKMSAVSKTAPCGEDDENKRGQVGRHSDILPNCGLLGTMQNSALPPTEGDSFPF